MSYRKVSDDLRGPQLVHCLMITTDQRNMVTPRFVEMIGWELKWCTFWMLFSSCNIDICVFKSNPSHLHQVGSSLPAQCQENTRFPCRVDRYKFSEGELRESYWHKSIRRYYKTLWRQWILNKMGRETDSIGVDDVLELNLQDLSLLSGDF